MKSPLVLKFGGSSLADSSKFFHAASKIAAIKKKENRPIACVLSAPADITDDLLKISKAFVQIPREQDALACVGEQISAALMAMALKKLGVPAVSFNAFQLPIEARGKYQKAEIKSVGTEKIKAAFSKGKTVLITGFQGILENSDIATLGRGGSDLSAAVIAKFLKAEKCFLFSDVRGVYSANPSIVSSARPLEKISYDELIALAREGCEVRQLKSVIYAKKEGVKLQLASSWEKSGGTLISNENSGREISCINLSYSPNIARAALIGPNPQKNPGLKKAVKDLCLKKKIRLFSFSQAKNRLICFCRPCDADKLARELHSLFF